MSKKYNQNNMKFHTLCFKGKHEEFGTCQNKSNVIMIQITITRTAQATIPCAMDCRTAAMKLSDEEGAAPPV